MHGEYSVAILLDTIIQFVDPAIPELSEAVSEGIEWLDSRPAVKQCLISIMPPLRL